MSPSVATRVTSARSPTSMRSIVTPIMPGLPRPAHRVQPAEHRVQLVLHALDLFLELDELLGHGDELAARGEAQSRQRRFHLLLGRLLRRTGGVEESLHLLAQGLGEGL